MLYIKKMLQVFVFALCLTLSQDVFAQAVSLSPNAQILNDNVAESAELLEAWSNQSDHLTRQLMQAYETNPFLQSKRAEYEAVKENLPQAQAGFLPDINAEAGINYSNVETEGQNFGNADGGQTSKNLGLTLDQPLFRGGSTLANIKGANAVVAAQRAALIAATQDFFVRAVTAYIDTMRSHADLMLNQNNLTLNERELAQAEARFEVGELTRTDVAQARARLSLAQSQVTLAQGSLDSAIAVYEELFGVLPELGVLALPNTALDLPQSLSDVQARAVLYNLDVIIAENNEIAASYDVDSFFGALLPQITARGSFGRDYTPSAFVDEQDRTNVGIVASIPLYQSGTTRSQLRQSKHVASQRLLEVGDAKNQARRQAAADFASLQSAKAEIASRKAQVEASRIAREGVQLEAEFGERTTLDALDANQELLSAQLSLIDAYRNEIVARYNLARTLGLLTPDTFL